jgi:hypothetical protein
LRFYEQVYLLGFAQLAFIETGILSTPFWPERTATCTIKKNFATSEPIISHKINIIFLFSRFPFFLQESVKK